MKLIFRHCGSLTCAEWVFLVFKSSRAYYHVVVLRDILIKWLVWVIWWVSSCQILFPAKYEIWIPNRGVMYWYHSLNNVKHLLLSLRKPLFSQYCFYTLLLRAGADCFQDDNNKCHFLNLFKKPVFDWKRCVEGVYFQVKVWGPSEQMLSCGVRDCWEH